MPRTSEAFERIREDSRERILDAALELFAHHGFASTSVRVLSERAGVSPGLLYNYFDGKRGLLSAIVERSMAEVRETFVAAEAASPDAALAVLIRAAFDAVRANPRFWRLSYQIRMQPEVLADVGQDVVAAAEQIRARIGELLARSGRGGDALSCLVFAAIDGAAQHWVLDPDHYPLDAVAHELERLLRATPDENEE